jgi:outer membrane autotransporter protein
MNYHVFLVSLGLKPSEEFQLKCDLTYTMNEGAFDAFTLSGIDPQAVSTLVASGNWSYDFSGVEDLSNVDTNTWNINVGADYQFTEEMSLYSTFTYAKWEDEDYIFRDDTGDYMIGSLGLIFNF